MFRKYYILLGLVIGCLCACTPRSIQEAQSVVTQADSLWKEGKQYGVDEGDSATLARAYETLGAISFPFREVMGLGSTYAHSCYHYGRLLRAKDNPVEAMQVFIEATHSRTRDYHILGRVYSNMGDICHLAGYFPFAYDMYERSGDMYLRNGDTLLYYYDLNNMAYELAEQGKKNSASLLINRIEKSCTNEEVLLKTLETKAVVCKKVAQYDSTIYYTSQLLYCGCKEPAILLLRAQAYSFLGENDSAVYYANYVLSVSKELFNENSALYILTHDDESKDKQDIRKTSADRSDVQKLIEIQQGKLSQAVQLLEQDIHRKPNLTWLYAICGTLLLIGILGYIYIHRKRKQRQLLSQQIEALVSQNTAAKQEHEQIIQEHTDYTKTLVAQIKEDCAAIAQADNFPKNICWVNFNEMCNIIDRQFCMLVSKLRRKKSLNETEIRLCILVLLDLSRVETASILPYALNSVGKLKDQTAKSLGTTGKNLRDFLLKMIVEGSPD